MAFFHFIQLVCVVFIFGYALPDVQSKTIVPFRKNIEQVLRQWNCNKPQSRLIYLGNYSSD